MPNVICWKCRRSVTPFDKREKDPKTGKVWLVSYCEFDRCHAALDLKIAAPIKLWNSQMGYFEDETDVNP